MDGFGKKIPMDYLNKNIKKLKKFEIDELINKNILIGYFLTLYHNYLIIIFSIFINSSNNSFIKRDRWLPSHFFYSIDI